MLVRRSARREPGYRPRLAEADELQNRGEYQIHRTGHSAQLARDGALHGATLSGNHAPWTAGTVMPIVWKHRYGRARIFYSALDHVAAEFDVPQMRAILRPGPVWAARGCTGNSAHRRPL